ncbi:MAG: AbgT family transporter, partial [Planctomycetota bacterium]
GTVLVMLASALFATLGVEVQPKLPETVLVDGVEQLRLVDNTDKDVLTAVNLLSSDGLYWCLSTLVDNFIGFAPLGIVLVGMLGIGVSERSGLLADLLKLFATIVPNQLITPAFVFLGIMSSLGMDAGYVVLPPLAAAVYAGLGRSPLVGIAAVFAGVSAGFNANLLVTGLDPLLAGITNEAGAIIDPTTNVAPTANWYFMAASTIIITFAGWFATAFFVERRMNIKPAEEGGPSADHASEHEPIKVAPLIYAIASFFAVIALVIILALIPGSPLYGKVDASDPKSFDRWVANIVPILFFAFLTPGLVFGFMSRTIKGGKDITDMMIETMKDMAPIIVLAFFAGQFVKHFEHSNLGAMLAYSGGELLFAAGLQNYPILLLIAFIIVVAFFNLFMGSMSAKYLILAPIFVPMLMLVNIRPELTQVTYRIGDSITNIVTPLNAYLIIILVFIQQYAKKAGMGTIISLMLPYTFVFGIVWTILLIVWHALGIPLGPGDSILTPDATQTILAP